MGNMRYIRKIVGEVLSNVPEVRERVGWLYHFIVEFKKCSSCSLLRVLKEKRYLTILHDKPLRSKSIYTRKAMAFKKLLENMPLDIPKDEILLIGKRTIFSFPGYRMNEYEFSLTDIFNLTPGYYNILNKGFKGIKDEANKKIGELKSQKKNNEKIEFLKSINIICDAVMDFVLKYSEKLKILASEEKNITKRIQLQKMSQICQNVPANPANTFHEALQALWFTHMLVQCEGHPLIGLGRFDQYMFPFYKKSIDDGVLVPEEAKKLLEVFWEKLNEDISRKSMVFEGDTGQIITLGGQTKDGFDATNDLSYLCLETTMKLKLVGSKIVVRLHNNTPTKFLNKACELACMGMGFPLFVNDEVIIPALQDIGYTITDARDYSVAACWEPLVPGRTFYYGDGTSIILLKCLEAVLNHGKSLVNREKIGLDIGDLTSFNSFDELQKNVKKEITYAIKKFIKSRNEREFAPAPLLSLLMDDCIENARDISKGGCRYNDWGVLGASLANTADALATIKKLVFEEKVLSSKELYKALLKNYNGYEDIRQMLINKVPKFGNDDDYVDSIAKDIAEFYCNDVLKYKNPYGGRYRPGFESAGQFIFSAKKLGPSTDGRKAREHFASNLSPSPGIDKNGPTAVIKSITKIDSKKAPNGSVLDLTFSPTLLDGDGITNLIAIITSFIELGGAETHLNIISSKILRDAQRKPENYRHLIVRVWGFSAYFVDLPKDFQDHIIQRAEGGYNDEHRNNF